MLSLPPTVRIFVAVPPADLRRGFDGLAQLAREALQQDPFSGHLFVFSNRRRDRIKILYWDRDGYVIWMKRLERGSLCWPSPRDTRVELTAAELAAILGGIDLSTTRRRLRYVRPVA